MVVAAHGKVDEYCVAHDMTISARYEGDIEEYDLPIPAVVTDALRDKNEYYYLKYKFLKRGIELISIHHGPSCLNEFIVYLNNRDRERYYNCGRPPFGFVKRKGVEYEDPARMVVVRRIFELWDAGASYKEIVADEGVHYPDGRKMRASTIQVILRNRKKYERKN